MLLHSDYDLWETPQYIINKKNTSCVPGTHGEWDCCIFSDFNAPKYIAAIHSLIFLSIPEHTNSRSFFTYSVCFSYKSWNRTSCHCSRPTLNWVKKVASCKLRRRYWKKRSSAGKPGPRSVKRSAGIMMGYWNVTLKWIMSSFEHVIRKCMFCNVTPFHTTF